MITARPQKNLATAKAYFREHLGQGDYHSEGQTVAGHWFGKGALRLGLDLAKPVGEAEFIRLCENQHPLTGEQLTVRRRQKDRRVLYDFVVSAPKSVSVMALTVGDTRLISAHDEAALAAVAQMERVAGTRVRQGGKDSERPTGELVAARFRHDTSRALDPQLHTHFVVFNATWDPVEQRWKALQTSRMFDRMTFYTEVYRNELALRVRALGYELRTTANGFEIAGVSADIIERFSKRRRAILDAEAEVAGKLGQPLSNNARATLAHTSREAKDKTIEAEEVLAAQRSQLSEEELAELRRLLSPSPKPPPLQASPDQVVSASEAIEFARDHLFERRSVVEEHQLLKSALAYARGTLTLDQLSAELARRPEFLSVDDQLTTRQTLRAEQRLIRLVNQGVGQCRPLNAAFKAPAPFSSEQRAALGLILSAPDRVIGLQGGAGTGKTTLLLELVRGIEARQPVTVLTPTTAGVEALRSKGLSRTATVQRFLADESFQASTRGQVLVVDEAGLLSAKDLLALVEHVQPGGRLVLSGDTRQHTGVEAGDALRLLKERSHLRMAGVHTILRQVRSEYRLAITDLAKGNGAAGLRRLERLGAVLEVPDAERYPELAADYVASVKAAKAALIVSPTWSEIGAITGFVREKLKSEGRLGREDTELTVHAGLKWTRAQKRDLRNYQRGLILAFHRRTRDFGAGEWGEVVRVEANALHVRRFDGREVQVTRKQAASFEVMEQAKLLVAPGEQLLIQANRKEDRLFNGQLVIVKAVAASGQIELTDGRRIAPDFRAFTHGYCVTSHASQGRTVDHVFVAVSSLSWQAAHRNQFYVSASRACEQVKVYTDDLEFLRDAVQRPGARLSASELFEAVRTGQRENLEQRPRARTRLAA